MITYNTFFETLKIKKISQNDLINKHNISAYTLTRMRRNEAITTQTIDKLCNILDVTPSNILEYKKD